MNRTNRLSNPMSYTYLVSVVRMADDDQPISASPITLQTIQRDELEQIIDRIRKSGIVPEQDAAELALGLKMFGETLLRHRRTPPFATLFPHFRDFMSQLKKRVVSEESR